MSKYPYFGKKKGRPSKLEQNVCLKINKLLNEGKISESDIDDWIKGNDTPSNLEELENMYSFLTGEEAPKLKKKYFTGQENSSNIEPENSKSNFDNNAMNISDDDFSGEIPSEKDFDKIKVERVDAVGFNPFEEPVIERSYTQGFVGSDDDSDDDSDGFEDDSSVEFDEDDFDEPQGGDSVADDLNNRGQSFQNYEEEIPEPDWRNTFTEEEDEDDDSDDSDDSDDEGSGKLGEGNLEDLSPAQKRKAAEKTADAILQMYCKFAPMPFKAWASFSDNKVQKMVYDGRLDLNMQVENGVTVKDFIDGTNEQVEEIFEVSEETKQEIKDPLIDVLLEQEIALTPTQRLLLAVGSHVVQMGFSAYQLSQNNKMALESFEKFHQQNVKRNNPPKPKSQRPNKTTSNPIISEDDLSESDRNAVEELLNEINKDDDGVIDAEHDPSITVEETESDD